MLIGNEVEPGGKVSVDYREDRFVFKGK